VLPYPEFHKASPGPDIGIAIQLKSIPGASLKWAIGDFKNVIFHWLMAGLMWLEKGHLFSSENQCKFSKESRMRRAHQFIHHLPHNRGAEIKEMIEILGFVCFHVH
jgi:hypothetical protein